MPSKRGRGSKRQHVYRRPKDRAGLKFTGSHRCPECGKWCYRTRGDAEVAARQAHPGAVMHYYQCESTGQDWWHITSMTAAQLAEIREIRADDVTNDDEWDGDAPKEVALPAWERTKTKGRRSPRTRARTAARTCGSTAGAGRCRST